ncbi:hypothetical protein K461DRAFT_297781 [Myriangium duriaei CBS 260.36]|uniref:2EXR domain-containing protein n=1 Tax=Myriangium duriaei CBS 260.36 TaxID=1168546 RepID=A0A9P4ITS0_9PEZI|nr:hypothetical protein K461DRAFT_297781 [Myriangium duriaei CBS 260.36]
MSSKTTPSRFHQFSRLPPEIRVMIWKFSLAHEPRRYQCIPGLEPFTNALSPMPVRFSHGRPDSSIDFTHDQLEVAFPIPTVAKACHEAREVVLNWAAANGKVEKRGPENKKEEWVIRPFEFGFDILYFVQYWWMDASFWTNKIRGFASATALDILFRAPSTAVNDDVLANMPDFLHFVLRRVKVLYVVCDAPRDQNGYRKIGSPFGGVWTWKHKKERFIKTVKEGDDAAGPRYLTRLQMRRREEKVKWLDEKIQGLCAGRGMTSLRNRGKQSLEIRPVSY